MPMDPITYELASLRYNRKPSSFEDVTATVSPAQVKQILKGQHLPIYEPKDLWPSGTEPGTFDDFTIETPQVFALRLGEDMFLVNTEGYSYCRYVARFMERATFTN